MTTPIRDARGRAIGALSGVVNLSQPNFLKRILGTHLDETGGTCWSHDRSTDHCRHQQTPRDGTTPGPRRQSGNRPLHSGLRRFHRSRQPARGGSARLVQTHCRSEWSVGVTMPTEAFAPIEAMQQRMLLAAIFFTLLVSGLTWLMLRQQFLPMLATMKTLASLADQDCPCAPARHPAGRNRRTDWRFQPPAGNPVRKGSSTCARVRNATALFSSTRPMPYWFIATYRTIFVNDAAVNLFHTDSATALIGRDWQRTDRS